VPRERADPSGGAVPSQSPDKTPDQAAGKTSGSSPGRPAARTSDRAGAKPSDRAGAKGSSGKAAQGKGGRPAGSRPGRHRLSAAERAREKRRRTVRALIVTAVAVVVVGGIVGVVVSRNAAQQAAVRDLHVQTLPNLGQGHLDPGGKYTKYNSTPPTSGPHDPAPAPCGVTTEPIANEVQVHDLEHGVIMVQYRPGLEAAQVSRLEALGRSYSSHVIVAPYPGLPTAVAATAWTRLMTLDNADTGKLRRFIDLYRQKGPEQGVACPAS
jgi:hypothetical protein